MVRKVHHVAILVRDLEAARQTFECILGLKTVRTVELAKEQAMLAFLPIGDVLIELIAGASPEAPLSVEVREKGEGLHHIAFEVNDICGALRRVRESGIGVRDDSPRQGADGLISFLDPAHTANALIEFVQKS